MSAKTVSRKGGVTQAAPSDNAFVADDTTKNADKQHANDHPALKAGK